MSHVFKGLWVLHQWDYQKSVVDVSDSMSVSDPTKRSSTERVL